MLIMRRNKCILVVHNMGEFLDQIAQNLHDLAHFDAVGGHGSKESTKSTQILQYKNFLLKPVLKVAERHFYNKLYSKDSESYIKHQQIMPKFYGIVKKNEVEYLVLENISCKIQKLCVLDVKMGTKSYSKLATEAKKISESSKFPLQAKIGLRLVGIKSPSFKSTREWSLSHTEESLSAAVKAFFFSNKELMQKAVAEMKRIKQVLMDNSLWEFIGSSLLFVFDEENPVSTFCLKMIDFAHVFDLETNVKDDKYLVGLNYLINMVEKDLTVT